MAEKETGSNAAVAAVKDEKKAVPNREIPGNMPYTSSVGVFKRAIQKIPVSERPPKFNRDFLNTVFEITGGSSIPVIPILKRVGFLTSDGTPTNYYSEFQTDGGRASAALHALKTGFSEIFKRNQYAHKADRDKIIDAIVSITGLNRADKVVGYIYGTFSAFQEYAQGADENKAAAVNAPANSDSMSSTPDRISAPQLSLNGISYQINLVLPATTNIEIYNTIFRSIRENLIK
ncbi:hypothetical protein EN925_20555 [Mesorhizobium sp. M7A.F.Ca.US.006.04.2.1]|uniref:DUF5343 domain-containing protein n=1 Tax=unclassified Mesorhizobium TaxID=325217 RepID=UPI000FCC5278|nr:MULTISPECIES: DUF5343 domain-containing protein [unclassified Mesorhizobium]RVA56191.1 hypothetical protein EN933_06685 [Mesorhizobium sp. M7A.F.Ca.US.001.01.1.1]MBZ9890997.1 DUF5343 domain-containing protein [Mesorhizobium sp. BR1-1-3]RUX70849.1 hypothetical protein EN990_30475 [Mesorhizobium sp. M7A.F.Ca.US.005.03.1.1]RUY18568.1 hypothetical protein EN991_03755 [Mesorhizobium sp. M7A.F.Ca.US.005.03.2.1]RUY27183.1 hypothetical protein EN979_17190 [Mesorhizobium sp. M7A.F.Ca.US.001.04.2.1]